MPSADGSSTRGGSTSVRGRVRSLHMANLQAASVPIACAMGQTDRPTNGRIAVSLNAPPPYGGLITTLSVRQTNGNRVTRPVVIVCHFLSYI